MRTVSVASDLFDFSIHFISFLIISLITFLFLLPDIFNFLNDVDNPLCNSAEDFGTLAENKSYTSYEPNDHFTTEAYVEYTQESLGEQRFPDDFDDDDVTIGKTLLDACRRRADHSEEEGLSSCLSSVSHDRTGRDVVCRLVERSRNIFGEWPCKNVEEVHSTFSRREEVRELLPPLSPTKAEMKLENQSAPSQSKKAQWMFGQDATNVVIA